MKKLILWLTLFCVAVSAAPVGPIAANRRRASAAGPVLLSHLGASLGSSGGTSGSIDTTGANLIIIGVSYFEAMGSISLSDNKGNTWTGLTAQLTASNSANRLYYCYNPIVGSGHTYTYTGTVAFAAITVSAWSGMAASPFDVENGAVTNGSGTTLAPGSITPSQGNTLVISMFGDTTTSGSISASGFTTSDSVAGVGGASFSGTMAYKILTISSAQNPLWTSSSGFSAASAVIADFKY